MSFPQPKILTRITVPAGGWTLRLYLSVSSQFDTQVNATLAAGDYYMAWDGQSDDLIYALNIAVRNAIKTIGAPYSVNDLVNIWIDATTHKVKIAFVHSLFEAGGDVRLDWPSSSDDLAKVLGFDASATDDAVNTDYPIFAADHHHSHGWYADADGVLRAAPPDDFSAAAVQFGMSAAGMQAVQLFGERFFSEVELYGVPRAKMWSGGKAYGDASSHPYARNEALECWWRACMDGTPFRLYYDGKLDTALSDEHASSIAAHSTTTLTAPAGKSWSTDPQRWTGRLLYLPSISDGTTTPARFHIAGHTSNVLTVTNAHPLGVSLGDWMGGGDSWHIFDQPYQTYQIDAERMQQFRPEEIPALDEYIITLPLVRYVAP